MRKARYNNQDNMRALSKRLRLSVVEFNLMDNCFVCGKSTAIQRQTHAKKTINILIHFRKTRLTLCLLMTAMVVFSLIY